MKKDYISPAMLTVALQHKSSILALSRVETDGGVELEYNKQSYNQGNAWTKGNTGNVNWDDDWSE